MEQVKFVVPGNEMLFLYFNAFCLQMPNLLKIKCVSFNRKILEACLVNKKIKKHNTYLANNVYKSCLYCEVKMAYKYGSAQEFKG